MGAERAGPMLGSLMACFMIRIFALQFNHISSFLPTAVSTFYSAKTEIRRISISQYEFVLNEIYLILI